MGFHAPQEAARVLGEAIDYARQGQVAAITWRAPLAEAATGATGTASAATDAAAPATSARRQ